MKNWRHTIKISVISLEPELNALSERGYEIYKILKTGNEYEIVAFKELLNAREDAKGITL